MDRVYFKNRAKLVLQNHFWYLIGIVLTVALLSMELFGVNAEYTNSTGYYDWHFQIKLFNFNFEFYPELVILTVLIITFISLLFSVFIRPVLKYGNNNVFKYAALDRIHEFNVFDGFKYNYGKIVMVNLVKSVIIFGYSLLLIVPGIIKSYELRYTNEILEEHPEWGYQEVFAKSKELTEGIKMDLFVLDLSFFGWGIVAAILSLVTLGLAEHAYMVYPHATNAEVYLWLKNARRNEEFTSYMDVNVEETYL